MEPIVAAREVEKAYGSQSVLKDASFLLHEGEKAALVGANGTGKSTIFRLLVGELRPDLGNVAFREGLRIGYLPQVPNVAAGTPVREVLASPTREVLELEREAAALEEWMGQPGALDGRDAGERMARYEAIHARLGTAKSKADIGGDPILSDLGVGEELLEQHFGTLSGGEKSKVLLARALANAKEKDLLLLDEPTNHMDIPTIEFIEEFLMGIDAAVLLASHDKYLLDNVAGKVLEVEARKVVEWTGNFSDYRGQKEAYLKALEAKRKRHYDEVKRQLAIIEDFKARKRWTQVRARRIGIERLERDAPEEAAASRAFRLVFQAAKAGRSALRAEGLSMRFGERLLFSDVNLEVEVGDKIGVVGPNGCGKTTLLEILIGQREPEAGRIERGSKMRIGYFSQSQAELAADHVLVDEIRSVRTPPAPEAWARGFLGRFGFGGDVAFKKVGDLSGGERARLALAKFIAQDYHLLVLDEPTNHLDIDSQEIVAAALREYPGSVVLVSHNRSFLNETCAKIAVLAHRTVRVFRGTFRDSWAAANMAEFIGEEKARYRVLRVVRDWEKRVSYHQGEVIALTGAETQAFLRLLRWAEAEGRVERLDATN